MYHFYGGVKGNLGFLEYSGQGGYKIADDLALFLPETDPENDIRKRFDVLYDSVTIVNINGTITADLFKDFTVGGTVNQNIYTTSQQDKPWHLPALTVNGTVTYTTLEGKLALRGEIFVENGVPYINDEGKADNLNGLFDVSVGAEYFFSKNFGGFLQIYNLADNKRQRWDDYPTFGINFLVGASARF